MKKKIIGLLILLQVTLTTWSQALINVSTGTDFTGTAAEPVGNADPHWQIGGSPLYVAPSYLPYWQPTPIAVSNAGWINQSGTIFSNPPGIHVMERKFTIPPGTLFFNFTYSVAYDDILQQLELVTPGGVSIPLAFNATNPWYFLPSPVSKTICAPAAGTWQIRATMNFVDNVGGFLLSGYINTITCCGNPDRDPKNNNDGTQKKGSNDKLIKRPPATAAVNSLQTLVVAPNPSSDMVTLELSKSAPANTQIQVADLSGRRLQEMAWPTAASRIQLRTAALLPGTYQIVVYANGQKIAAAKMVKQ